MVNQDSPFLNSCIQWFFFLAKMLKENKVMNLVEIHTHMCIQISTYILVHFFACKHIYQCPEEVWGGGQSRFSIVSSKPSAVEFMFRIYLWCIEYLNSVYWINSVSVDLYERWGFSWLTLLSFSPSLLLLLLSKYW